VGHLGLQTQIETLSLGETLSLSETLSLGEKLSFGETLSLGETLPRGETLFWLDTWSANTASEQQEWET